MTPIVRKLTQYVPLTREEFRSRFFERFYDPAFDDVRAELDKIGERAWDGYIKYRKSPRTQPAGGEFSDPAFALPVEWLQTRSSIKEAERRHRDPASPSRILIVSGATRSECRTQRPASSTWCARCARASTRRPTPDCAIQDRSNFRPAAGITLRAAGNARPCGRDRHQGR